MWLIEPIWHKGHLLFTDNFYTTVATYTEWANKGINKTGIIKKNRKLLSSNFGKYDLDQFKSKIFYNEKRKLMKVEWKDKQTVCVLSKNIDCSI